MVSEEAATAASICQANIIIPKLTITTLASYYSSVHLLTWCWPRLHNMRWWASHGLRFHNHFLLPSQWQDTPAPQSRSRWTPQISELPESLWDIHLRQICFGITAGCSKILKSASKNSNDLKSASYPKLSQNFNSCRIYNNNVLISFVIFLCWFWCLTNKCVHYELNFLLAYMEKNTYGLGTSWRWAKQCFYWYAWFRFNMFNFNNKCKMYLIGLRWTLWDGLTWSVPAKVHYLGCWSWGDPQGE